MQHGMSNRSSLLDFGVLDTKSIFCFSKFGQCKRGQRQLCEVVKYLNKKIDVSSQYSPYAPIWWKLLAQLYIITPNLTVWDEILTPEENDAGTVI